MTLRSLRPPGTRTRAIPRGYGFSLVSCPNYFFEVMGWGVVTGMTNSPAGKLLSRAILQSVADLGFPLSLPISRFFGVYHNNLGSQKA